MGRKKKEKPKKFEFEVGEDVVYVGGLFDKYDNKSCKILSRSRDNDGVKTEWYRLKFEDENEILQPGVSITRKDDTINAV